MKLLFKNLSQRFLTNCFYTTVLCILFYLFFRDSISLSIIISGHNVAALVIWIILFFYILFDFIYYFFQNKPAKLEVDYFREHIKNYSPSMVSLLMNLKIEVKKDILADLLYLNNLKYIEINYETNACHVLRESPFEKHLLVLWNLISSQPGVTISELLDKSSFLGEKHYYEKACYEEGIRIGIIESKKMSLGIRSYVLKLGIVLFCLLFFGGIFQGSNFLGIFLLSVIFTFFISLFLFLPLSIVLLFGKSFLFKNQSYIRTKNGKEDVKYWYAYSNFLRDFTHMEDKDLKYNLLLDYTFPYSLCLGFNKKVISEFSLEQGSVL